MTDPAGTLAVVPILVNVGAAVLPALVGGLASAMAVLVRPRELLRLCRRKPWAPLLVIALAAGGWYGGTWLTAPAPQARAQAPQPGTLASIDWPKLALEILSRRQIASTTAPASPDTGPASRPVQAGPVIFRADAARTGHDGGPAPVGLALLWSHTEPQAMFLSSPAVARGRAYAASCVLDPPGNYGSVACLDVRTGGTHWVTEAYADPDTGKEVELKGFFSSPAITADGRYVLIGQGLHYDKDCALLCLEAATGKLHWRVRSTLHLEGSPAVLGDLAVAGFGAIENEQMKPVSDPGYVVGVRISDGKVLWRHPVNDPESSPAIDADGNTCYIGSGFNGCRLVALRTADDATLAARGQKRELWNVPTPHPATGAVTLAGEAVIIGCGNGNYVYADPRPAGSVLAFDRRTGRKLWELRTADAVLGAVAVRDGLAICPVRNGEVLAVSIPLAGAPADGPKVLWRQRISGSAPVLAAAALAGPFVYAVSKDGYLAVLRASDGQVVEKHYVNDEARPGEMGLSVSSPVVAEGRLLVGSETGGLRCLAGKEAR